MGFWETFQEGGWVMYPLLLSSLASWCVIFEKWVIYRRFSRTFTHLFEQVSSHISKGRIEEAKEICRQKDSDLVVNPLLAYLNLADSTEENRERKAANGIAHTNLELRRYLWILATVGSSAPFVGLLGTVTGIIRSFGDIARLGKGGFSVVSAGISEALIATAAGILVAVIAVVFFNYYQVRLNYMMARYKHCLADLGDVLREQNRG